MATFPQGWHECQIRYDRDDHHKCEEVELDAPERDYYERGEKERDRDIFFNMPHKKQGTG